MYYKIMGKKYKNCLDKVKSVLENLDWCMCEFKGVFVFYKNCVCFLEYNYI